MKKIIVSTIMAMASVLAAFAQTEITETAKKYDITSADTLQVTESGVSELLRMVGSAKLNIWSSNGDKQLIIIVVKDNEATRSILNSDVAVADTMYLSAEKGATLIADQKSAVLPGIGNGNKVTVEVVSPYAANRRYKRVEMDEDNDTKSIWDIENPFSRLYSLSKRQPKRQSRKPYGVTTAFKNIYVGGVIATDAPDGISSSWEAGVANVIAGEWRFSRTSSISIGAGFGFSQVRVRKGMIPVSENGKLLLTTAPQDAVKADGMIHNFHFSIPLMYTQKFNRSFGLSLGAELHLNTYSHATATVKDKEGISTKTSYKGLHQRMATPSLVAILGWTQAAGVYVRYNPVRLWDEAYGPQYRTWAIGLSLSF